MHWIYLYVLPTLGFNIQFCFFSVTKNCRYFTFTLNIYIKIFNSLPLPIYKLIKKRSIFLINVNPGIPTTLQCNRYCIFIGRY